MELRAELIREWKEGESIAALAEAYGVSRKTIYKWADRHEVEGVAGLADRSRAPHHSPQKVSAEMIAHIVEARQRWGWGPRKLLVKMAEAWPEEKIPSASTVAEVLRGKGLSHARKRRLRTPPYAQPFAEVAQSNRTWCADFKGWFRTTDGTRCDPLTITDAYSRFLLCCQIVARLSMRWVRLGIVAERSRPSSPQDNGRHERMHRTLKQDTLQPPARNPQRQQEAFRVWQKRHNEDRPHESLGYQSPASCYARSPRVFPRRVPEVEYDSGVLVRRVMEKGQLYWKGEAVFVSEIFRGNRLDSEPRTTAITKSFTGRW